MRANRTTVLALACATFLPACGDAHVDAAPPGTESRAIAGGVEDASDRNVVAVVRVGTAQIAECSGSLIAPNLILTAHHCVADLKNAANDQIDCMQSSFAPPDVPDNFLVTTRKSLSHDPLAYHGVLQVAVPPDSTDSHFCGLDLAILVLVDNVRSSEAAPLVPRVDSQIEAGEGYSAIGFGESSARGGDAGTRRRVDGLSVRCVDGRCANGNDTGVDSRREWVGEGGVCQGDSGGPALDDQHRVIGLVSRASDGCGSSIYESVFGWARWLKQSGATAAQLGGYAPPPWVKGEATGAGAGGGCASVDAGSASWLALAGACALGLGNVRRSRRSSATKAA